MGARRLAPMLVVLGYLATFGAPAASAATPVSEDQAIGITIRLPAVQKAIEKAGEPNGSASGFLSDKRWIVTVFAGDKAVAQAEIDRPSGRVESVRTGLEAAFPLARGGESGVGERTINAWWVWVPLTVIFVFAFFDWRRPFRLLHLDLLAIAALGISYAFFLGRRLGTSVPLVYPVLVYVVIRSLVAGVRPAQRAGPLTRLPLTALAVLTLGLLAGRIALLLADPFVNDVGYASVAGADRILDGLELYSRGGAHFDTYGPVAYLSYIPFVLIWPFREAVSFPAAAQAAAIFWDVATVVGLVVLGRRLRPGTVLGWALALAWVACPFTGLVLTVASNDAMVAALLVWMFVLLASPPVRGLLAGAAAAAKFGPGALAPLLARGPGRFDARKAVIFGVVFAAVVVVTVSPLLPPGGVREFYDETVGFQLHRASPFSYWGRHPDLDWVQTTLKVAALALALLVAFVPRGARTTAQVAALATAVLVAAQIPLQHWFYLYVPWFLPLYCVALFSEMSRAAGEPRAS